MPSLQFLHESCLKYNYLVKILDLSQSKDQEKLPYYITFPKTNQIKKIKQ